MTPFPARRYAKSQAETASPERLMVLLLEAALRHMREGAAALEQGRAAAANAPLARAADIVVQLDATFDAARNPELAKSLGGVYAFVAQRLVAGNAGRDAALVREAERVFAPVADAFATAVRQAAAERGGAGAR